ncbi:MAG: tetratricopeptide repeat protein, partial [Ignavibacteria bacterium]|nr:tetratricopeptide repeat protein [Ignavibacteria bacterium]
SIQGQALKKELHPLAFADDGLILYDDDQLEEFCIPANLRGERFFVEGSRYSIIDLHFINFENALIYSSWQQCARLVQPEMVLQGSDNFIIPVTEDRVVLKKANPEWFKNIPFIGHDSFQAIDDWRVRKIYEWFNQFGIDYFKDLPIWEINWKNYAALATYTPFTPAVIEMEGTSLMQTGTNKMRVAELAIQNNDYGVAERVLLDILAEDPKNIDALNNLAVIKILLEDYKNAEEILKRLTGIAPDDETANENLSYLKKIGKL